jgi:hypothetical protein
MQIGWEYFAIPTISEALRLQSKNVQSGSAAQKAIVGKFAACQLTATLVQAHD